MLITTKCMAVVYCSSKFVHIGQPTEQIAKTHPPFGDQELFFQMIDVKACFWNWKHESTFTGKANFLNKLMSK